MFVRPNYKEKRLVEWYANARPEDYLDCSFNEWAELYKYNKKIWDIANDMKMKKEKEVFARVKAAKLSGCTIEWQQCKHKKLPEPSAAEQLIITALCGYNVQWYREVEFLDHKKSDYGLYRYDFFLPAIMVVVEYDGARSHTTAEQKANDKEKNRFCKANKISMIRYSSKDYYHMDVRIGELMKQYGIRKK